MPSVPDITRLIFEQLQSFGIEEPEARRETQLIVSAVTGKSAASLRAFPETGLSDPESERLKAILERRRLREPLQYILCHTGFYGLEFAVGPGVFIPRPDTEILVEETIKRLQGRQSPLLAEIGVGSGAIAVSLLKLIPDATMHACEISPAPHAMAGKNARRHAVDTRLVLDLADWRQWIIRELGPFDALISNPPYIPMVVRDRLEPEVKDWEPDLALYGKDDDGLGFYREYSRLPPELFKENGFIALEFGDGQAESLKEIFASAGWSDLRFFPDLTGNLRVFSAFRKNTFEKA